MRLRRTITGRFRHAALHLYGSSARCAARRCAALCGTAAHADCGRVPA